MINFVMKNKSKTYLHVKTALNSDTSSGEKRTVKEASSPDRMIPSDGSMVNGRLSVPRKVPVESTEVKKNIIIKKKLSFVKAFC